MWVAGRQLLKSGELTTIDLNEVIQSAQRWQGKLARLEQKLTGEMKETMQ